MAKRQTGLSPLKVYKRPHKTAKRIVAKYKMLAAKKGIKGR